MRNAFSPSLKTIISEPCPDPISSPETLKPQAPKRGRRLSQNEWQQILADYDRGSLTVKEFCALKGLSQSNFYKKKRRFSRKTPPPQGLTLQAPSATLQPLAQTAFPDFVPISLEPPREAPSTPSSQSPEDSGDTACSVPATPSPSPCKSGERSVSFEPLTLILGPALRLSIPPNFHEGSLKKVLASLAP